MVVISAKILVVSDLAAHQWNTWSGPEYEAREVQWDNSWDSGSAETGTAGRIAERRCLGPVRRLCQ